MCAVDVVMVRKFVFIKFFVTGNLKCKCVAPEHLKLDVLRMEYKMKMF